MKLKHNDPFPSTCLNTGSTETIRNHTSGLTASVLQNEPEVASSLAVFSSYAIGQNILVFFIPITLSSFQYLCHWAEYISLLHYHYPTPQIGVPSKETNYCRARDMLQVLCFKITDSSNLTFRALHGYTSVAQSCPTPFDAMDCSKPASLSITNSQSSLRLMPVQSVTPSSHLILCRPLLLLPSIFPRIRVFSNESALRIR